ncbi:MAG TPA: beta-ketoacyl-[acyl-carrier-protein] synthase family protein [Planctomycetaceae bacterium]|jgi:3-oxoacyl-[acyl-carrier-protein] synthase II|nr:beta-ketoacyl-[acyl-carrier-protein] synthase family protein [Planctomycetaceae bacterium]
MKTDCRDVVVSGLGAVSPFGPGVLALWENVRRGKSAVDWIDCLGELDPDFYPVRYAAEVKGFTAANHLKNHCPGHLGKTAKMGLVAAKEALKQARLLDENEHVFESDSRVSVIIGSGHGPCHETEAGYEAYFLRGPAAIRPTTLPKCMFNSLSSNVSIHFGLTGANHVIASACSSATTAIGLALMMVRHGYADIVLCGGADAPLTTPLFSGWTKLRVLAEHEDPTRASRPFDRLRNGMVLGEGAAMTVIESRENAERRGVEPLAFLAGYGTASDARHLTTPTVDGQKRAIESCLRDADLSPDCVDYLNMHGTATRANDETEGRAVSGVFGPRGSKMPASSTKSTLGHALGASGAMEFAICIQTLREQFVPPTMNCDDPDPSVGLDYVSNEGRPHRIRYAMSNSFAFGGNNASLLLSACN